MNIVVSYDQATNLLPAGFTSVVASVVSFFDSAFTDNITFNLHVGYGTVGGGAVGGLGNSSYTLYQFSYAQLKTALATDARSGDDVAALASLPALDPVTGTNQFWATDVQAKALGLLPDTTVATGYVGFSSTAAFDYDRSNGITAGQYDFYGIVAHEIAEVMGKNLLVGGTIGSTTNSYDVSDLFHYSAAGVRDFSGTTPGYFSIDGGATVLARFNTTSGGDYGDWSGAGGADAWNAFSSPGVVNGVTESDLKFLDAIGYNRAGIDLKASALSLDKSSVYQGGSVTVAYSLSNVGSLSAAPTTVGIYKSADGVFDASDTLIGTRAIGVLGAGVTVTDTFDLTLSTTGACNIIVVADYDNRITAETSETNNVSNAAAVSVITFTEGSDTATVPFAGGTWHALGGDDFVVGSPGADFVYGDAGNDTLLGGDDPLLTAGQKQIYRLYGAALNRAPDAAGLAAWANMLAGGASLASIAAGFVNSTEFKAAYGSLNNTQFATLLYNNVLHRAPDAAGLASWVAALAGGASRASVVTGFSESQEYQAGTDVAARGFALNTIDDVSLAQVFRLYGSTFNRAPDAAGFEFWANQMKSGQSLSTLTNSFIGSPEFQSTYGSLNNNQFVTLLYNNVLKRAPDAAGFASWLSYVNGGGKREAVVDGFSESGEFQASSAAALKTFMQTTMTAWADTLNGGAGDDILAGGRGADTYQFDRNAPGSDQVYGFEAWDILNFQNFGYANAAAAASHMTQSGADVLFADQGETITFHNAALSAVAGATMSFA